MGIVLFVLGLLVGGVGGIWLLVVAFRQSILWGLGCLVVPFVELVFIIMYWHDAKRPFAFQLVGFVLMVLGMVLMPELAEEAAAM